MQVLRQTACCFLRLLVVIGLAKVVVQSKLACTMFTINLYSMLFKSLLLSRMGHSLAMRALVQTDRLVSADQNLHQYAVCVYFRLFNADRWYIPWLMRKKLLLAYSDYSSQKHEGALVPLL